MNWMSFLGDRKDAVETLLSEIERVAEEEQNQSRKEWRTFELGLKLASRQKGFEWTREVTLRCKFFLENAF